MYVYSSTLCSACTYVCMSLYSSKQVYVCMRVHAEQHESLCKHVCVQQQTSLCMYVLVQQHTRAYVQHANVQCMYVCMSVQKHAVLCNVCTCVCTSTPAYVFMSVCSSTQVQVYMYVSNLISIRCCCSVFLHRCYVEVGLTVDVGLVLVPLSFLPVLVSLCFLHL